ncbi:LacI family DNA-binding transcriptional regulator [Roseomonas sp. AR75]|uniref:LacI family DNA-binding transcriptional regulator n=1 Tax=Roseomonas sp. AR75 TaxID=2562311 RepID=UPI0014853A3B|nr:LacI family DNA-binding transcriptional regulator [Roseomonas sp. AR75]
MPSAGARATSAVVARRAGVSVAAVSRAFTPGATIAPQTRQRVLAAASDLGYVPRTLLRVAVDAPPSIGIVMGDMTNPFFAEVLGRLTLGLRARGYGVQVQCAPRGTDVDAVIPDLFRVPLAGVLMGSATLSPGLKRVCRERKVPVVLLNRAVPTAGVSMVGCDNHAGGMRVAELFLRTQRRRIAFMAGRPEIASGIERARGFRDALAAAGRTLHATEAGSFEYGAGYEAARRLFAPPEHPDAVFCANDMMAIALLDHLRHERGLRVPEDVSVVGFDDIAMASWPTYRLTTIRQRTDTMTEEAIDLLVRLGTAPESAGISRLVSGELIQRATTLPEDGGTHRGA